MARPSMTIASSQSARDTRVAPNPSLPEATKRASMGRATTIMVALTLLASATNYLSNLVFGRLLTPESFGDLTALLALAVIVATPTAAAQTVIAERVAAYHAVGDTHTLKYLIRHATAHVLLISIAVGAVYTVCVPLVVKALNLQA